MQRRWSFIVIAAAMAAIPSVLAAANLDTLWVAHYTGPTGSDDVAYGVHIDAFDNCYVYGRSTGVDTSYDIMLLKYAPDSTLLWERRYEGPGPGHDIPAWPGLAADGAGNIYLTGLSTGVGTGYDIVVIKYDTTGTEHWVRRYNGAANLDDVPNGIAVDSSGNVAVTGFTTVAGGTRDVVIIKYDPDGDSMWVRTHNGPANGNDAAKAICADADGNFIIVGYERAATTGFLTAKYDSSGAQLWTDFFDWRPHGSYPDSAMVVTADERGNVYVSGASMWHTGYLPSYSWSTLKYGPDGIRAWVDSGYQSPRQYPRWPHAVFYDRPRGRIITTGVEVQAPSSTGPDWAFYAFDTGGTVLWRQTVSSASQGASDWALRAAVSPEGAVFGCGFFSQGGSTGMVYGTAKVSPAGANLWKAIYSYDPPSQATVAEGLAFDSQGNLYVTGYYQWNSVDSSINIGTIKYGFHDAALLDIVMPERMDTSDFVFPKAVIANWGSYRDSIPVRMRIGAGYIQLAYIALAPHEVDTVTFPLFKPTTYGVYVVRCSTKLGTEHDPSNGQKTDTLIVQRWALDVAAMAIEAPKGRVASGAVVTPVCSLLNSGATPCTYTARMRIGTSYDRTAAVSNHEPGTWRRVTFPNWTASGTTTLPVRCTTELTGDQRPKNDAKAGWVAVGSGNVGIVSIEPPYAGNTGTAEVFVSGWGFDRDSCLFVPAKLTNGVQTVTGGSFVRDSNSALTTFDLNGAQPGSWSLVFTNPGGESAVAQGFEVQPGIEAAYVTISGPKTIGLRRKEDFRVTLYNAGNADLLNKHNYNEWPSPVTVCRVTDSDGNLLWDRDSVVVWANLSRRLYPERWLSAMPGLVDSVLKYGPVLYLPVLVRGQSTAIVYTLTAGYGHPASWIGGYAEPAYEVPEFESFTTLMVNFERERAGLPPEVCEPMTRHPDAELVAVQALDYYYDTLDQVGVDPQPNLPPHWPPGLTEEVYRALRDYYSSGTSQPDSNAVKSLRNRFPDMSETEAYLIVRYYKRLPQPAASDDFAKFQENLQTIYDNDVAAGKMKDIICNRQEQRGAKYTVKLTPLSFTEGGTDPNHKVGPAGPDTLKGWIPAGLRFDYTVFFENVDTARAPAESIWVADTLDPDLDILTLELDSISHPAVCTTWFDPASRVITWVFNGIGLPPNKNPPEGEGFVSYSIAPKAGLTSGTEVRNRASIVFDINPPLLTNTWINTIDAGPPISSVRALPDTTAAAAFNVRWRGHDDVGGSGIDHFEVYVQTDTGPFDLWLPNAQDTTARFEHGQNETRYSFYCVAVDSAGNRESKSAVAEATTYLTGIGIPEYVFPPDTAYSRDGFIADSTPTFFWTPTAGSQGTYTLQYSNDSTFATDAETLTGLTDVYFELPDSMALEDTTWFWRVEAVGRLGAQSGYGAPRRFTVDTDGPATPALRLPADSSVVNDSQPRFVWSRVAGADAYVLYVTTDTLLADSLVFGGARTTDTSFTAPEWAPFQDTTYRWVVRAIDQAGNRSPIQAHPFQFRITTQRMISGNAGYYAGDNAPVESVKVLLSGAVSDTVLTDTAGAYLFTNLTSRQNYAAAPEKTNTGRDAAVSAFDAAMALRHAVHADTLDSLQFIAGDVSGDSSVSAFDAGLMLQYAVGMRRHFPVGYRPSLDTVDWSFLPPQRTYDTLRMNMGGENYSGILFGDPSGNWPAAMLPEPEGDVLAAAPRYLTVNIPTDERSSAPVPKWSSMGSGEVRSQKLETRVQNDATAVTPSESGESRGLSLAVPDALRLTPEAGALGVQPLAVGREPHAVFHVTAKTVRSGLSADMLVRYDARRYTLNAIRTTPQTEGFMAAATDRNGEVRIAMAGARMLNGDVALLELLFEPANSQEPIGNSAAGAEIRDCPATGSRQMRTGTVPAISAAGQPSAAGPTGNRGQETPPTSEAVGRKLSAASPIAEVVWLVINEPVSKPVVEVGGAMAGGGWLPMSLYLDPPRPNPFGAGTNISYGLPVTGDVQLKVFDAVGRSVRTLASGKQKAGRYSVLWNGKDQRGRRVATGIYFIKLQTDKLALKRKAMLVRS